MSKYRIVRSSRDTWFVQRKGWLFWRNEGFLSSPGTGWVTPHQFSSEKQAETYIENRLADEIAWAEPPREYPTLTAKQREAA